ncbi:flagellar protein FlaG [Paenibacillus shenyangensis]|uniref:flagellar protein FlaG n=1 Tax=Paenibacillus sp. A9 TaxID=1284352 RepID=UPI000363FB63|nr:flagellar protein FlaG [Paenibacillus sp. A9]
MNIQFSFSSNNTYTAAPAPAHQSSSDSKTVEERLAATTSLSQMQQLEKQGAVLPVGEEELMRRLDTAFKTLAGPETALEVSMHKDTHSIMVKVLNKETGEVIREVPREKTLDLVANMMKIAGILVDKKV